MPYEHLEFSVENGIGRITIARPELLNALAPLTVEELMDALDRSLALDARVLLITGAGRAFRSGADLGDLASSTGFVDGTLDGGAVLDTHFNPLLEKLANLPIPIVMAVNEVAAGAGASLALAGDLVLAARSASFLLAFVNIGLVPDVGATWTLPRLIGRARASAMMILGERIPADRAEAWGMIYSVVDDDQLTRTADNLCAKLRRGPTQAYGLIRAGLRASLDASLTETLAIERRHQRQAGHTSDFAEGVRAFLEKRPAQFQGR
jgi:2-(1,2-epoxy-1,2-dihydrophenyl)acetyl-CoA isomerase